MEKKSFQMANSIKPISLTPNFIVPEDKRPQLARISPLASIPIIDLNDHVTSSVLQKISQACEEYGFFQVINHGVPEELCEKVMTAITQFFELPPAERADFFTEDLTKQVRLFNYYLKCEGQEKVTMWSEVFSHPWHPFDDFTHLLPQNPPLYRYFFSPLAPIYCTFRT